MPDLGAIGTKGLLTESNRINQSAVVPYIRGVQAGMISMMLTDFKVGGGLNASSHISGGRDDAEGNPSPPSQKQSVPFIHKDIFWPVNPGTRTISIDVKYSPNSTPRPRLIVKANPSAGVNSDVEGTAPAGTGWVTIGPLNVVVTVAGVLQVWREWVNLDMTNVCRWDNLQVS